MAHQIAITLARRAAPFVESPYDQALAPAAIAGRENALDVRGIFFKFGSGVGARVAFDGKSVLPLLRFEKVDWPDRTLFFQWHRGDVPEIQCILIEDREPLGPSGAKGVGEPGLVPTAPAILGAVHHATGVRATRVPLLPHRLREAIRENAP